MSKFGTLKEQAELLLAKIQNGKYYKIGDLNSRLQSTAEQIPQDTVIQAVARVVEQMRNKEPDRLISQGEVEGLYTQLVGLGANTRFREVLGDLLLTAAPELPEQDNKFIQTFRDGTEDDLSFDADPEVKKDFDQLFEPECDKYNPQLALKAKEKVGLELRSLGFATQKISLAGGDAKMLVFSAEFDTNKGKVPVFIPVDASGDKLPTKFIAGDKMATLSTSNLKSYVDGVMEYRQLHVDNSNSSVVGMPSVALPAPLKMFAKDLDEGILETSTGYDKELVRVAKSMLLVELASMGFKGSQVKVSEEIANGFVCEAVLNTPRGKAKIEVPIEVKDNVPIMPSVFGSGDFIDDFTAPKLQAFAMSEMTASFINRDSDYNSFDIHQLKDTIIRSASQGDLEACDEILETISQKFGGEIYRNAVADYQKLLCNIKNSKSIIDYAYQDSKQFVKTPNSIYPIHIKLGRPAHELIRDENGEYHLKSTYHSRINQTASEGFFSNAKILIGGD